MICARTQLAGLVACAALIAGPGCGSDEEEPGPGVPRAAAEQLSAELDLVQRRIDGTREMSAPGSCRDIELKSYPDIEKIIDALPKDTDPDVRRALERSIDRLKELTQSECTELVDEIERRREESTPEVTPPPAPVQPEPTPEPTPTETQPREEKPEDEKPKEDKKEDGGGGMGPNGQGPPGQGGGGQPAPPAEGD